jgi:hypothetical protein
MDAIVFCAPQITWEEDFVDHRFADRCEEGTEEGICTAEFETAKACEETVGCCGDGFFELGECLSLIEPTP